MLRKAIYTSVTGNYDPLPQPLYVHPDYDYICLTDKVEKASEGVWQFRKNPNDNADLKRRSVWARLHPHLLLAEYDYSLYIDGNIQILDKRFYDYVESAIDRQIPLAQVLHPTRDCIYLELEQCLNVRKVTPWQYIRHRQRYTQAGLPKHWGLYENSILLRRHNDPQVVKLSEQWWEEYSRGSNRDQLSLMLVYWREQYKPELLFDDGYNIRTCPYIRCVSHLGNTTTPKECWWTRLRHYVERRTILPLYRHIVHAEDYSSQW